MDLRVDSASFVRFWIMEMVAGRSAEVWLGSGRTTLWWCKGWVMVAKEEEEGDSMSREGLATIRTTAAK